MNEKDHNAVQWSFGLVVFMFGTALAYFSAHYLDKNGMFDYWPTLAFGAVAYIIAATLLWTIASLSLGFLFAADVLILHVFFDNFGDWHDAGKATLLGVLLIVLYVAAYFKLRDPAVPIAPHPPVGA